MTTSNNGPTQARYFCYNSGMDMIIILLVLVLMFFAVYRLNSGIYKPRTGKHRPKAKTGAKRSRKAKTGRKADYYAYINSAQWKKKAARLKADAHYTCDLCGGTKGSLDAHHMTYKRLGHEWDRDIAVLCRGCHFGLHRARGMVKKAMLAVIHTRRALRGKGTS